MTSPEIDLDSKREHLLKILGAYGRTVVAFSGGVDSAVVAQAAWLASGDRAIAVTAVSHSLASGEREQAEALARQIGIRHAFVETDEFLNPDYVRNAQNRCYFCKTELYGRLAALPLEWQGAVLVNGANLDDQGDYRPGMQAAREHHVHSPLIEAGLGKAEVRALARGWNLPVWDKPASPCLASRIAYGLEVTPERTSRIDQAERFLRETFGIRELRVRHEVNDAARIEVAVTELPRLVGEGARQQICDRLHALGFKYVALDLDGFRSGSMNEALPLVVLHTPLPAGS
ncbi:MAG: ATP-dependent sacrificial sulfur transferase LarE [Planctomycetaceae bacterium]|nr:ATP-dependent sacrificial sulfur transferase LarE [Planctomycetaceae bacterium]